MEKYLVNGKLIAKNERELRSYYQEAYDENVEAGNIDEKETTLEDWISSDEELQTVEDDVYDWDKEELLKKVCNLSKSDLKKALEPGKVTIYSIDDYIEDLKGSNCLESELESWKVSSEEELKDLFLGGVNSGDGIEAGSFIGTLGNVIDFVIEFGI